MAVGIIGAQSIGEPGTQLTMRTFHIGGTAAHAVEESEIRAKKPGLVKFTRLKVVRNDAGQQVVLTRNGEILLLDAKGRELEKYEVPAGANLQVNENQEVPAGALLCQWDPHAIPILAEVGGKVRYEDVIEGETMRQEKDPSGHVRQLVMEHKGDLHPQIVLEDHTGKILDFYYLPEKANIEVAEGSTVSAGTLLAKTPREVSGTQDITGGLPRVTEIFEARKPKDPAVMAEIDGTIELLGKNAAANAPSSSAAKAASNANTSSPTASTSASTPAASSAPARPWLTAPSSPTTSSASPAKRPSNSTSLAKSKTSTAASACRSTTSTSRSSSRRCSANSASRPPATPPCCPARSWTSSISAPSTGSWTTA